MFPYFKNLSKNSEIECYLFYPFNNNYPSMLFPGVSISIFTKTNFKTYLIINYLFGNQLVRCVFIVSKIKDFISTLLLYLFPCVMLFTLPKKEYEIKLEIIIIFLITAPKNIDFVYGILGFLIFLMCWKQMAAKSQKNWVLMEILFSISINVCVCVPFWRLKI